jgi:uncharacterized protein YprB with RNaseH-like and TPR domain
MAPVDNLLKKQLAQIKARAMMIAGRATPDEVAEATQPAPLDSTSAPAERNEIVESALLSGAVVRGASAHTFTPLRRGPWWWRRRIAGTAFPPAPVEGSGFEAEFQRLLTDMMSGDPVPIEHAVPGEPRVIEDSNYYLIRLAGTDVDTVAPVEARQFAGFQRWPDVASRTVVGPRRADAGVVQGVAEAPASPDRILFLDIETAGLSANTYAFLVGLMYFDRGEFVVEQVFARDYTEEEGMLRHVRETMARYHTVVTYNGASFDLPFIRTRMSVHRIPDVDPVGSVDLLHSSRRVYREVLPNCRLVTVERHLRGVDRVDDIPSRFIPRAYHEYVRTKDARIMRNVVYHNRMDLFTMAVILNRLGEAGEASRAALEPAGSGHPVPVEGGDAPCSPAGP